MPPRKRKPFDKAILGPRWVPKLDCGCPYNTTPTFVECCGLRRCEKHHHSHTCGEESTTADAKP